MGMVFQQFNLFPHKTVIDNLTMAPVKLLGKSKDEAKKDAMDLLERVGLAEKANAYPIPMFSFLTSRHLHLTPKWSAKFLML